MWMYVAIGIAALIGIIILGKVASGLQIVWKIILFPFIAVYSIVKFIFKK